MKKLIFLVPLLMAGCANLTAQQQTNLQNELALGEKVVQATKNLYCLYEPVTNAIVGVFDQTTGAKTLLAQLSTATAILCQQALNSAAASTQ